MKLLLANQSTAAKRRVYFFCVDATDGITPETGEAGGQPQVSTDGAAWTDTGIGVLVAQGDGFYYAELTQAAVASVGVTITTKYKSVNTAMAPGTSVQVVAFDPDDVAALGLTNLDAAVSSRSTFAGGAVSSVTGNVGGNVLGYVSAVVGLTASYLDAPVTSRASSSLALEAVAMLHKNSVLDNNTYNSDGRLLSARLRCYDSNVNAALSGSTGLLFSYSISGSYNGNGTLGQFTMVTL